MVNLAQVASVSVHEYVVDGAARVTEFTVGTTGAVVARFYYIEPLLTKSPIGFGQSIIDKVQEKAPELAERTDAGEVWKKVVKNYPLTTHAHTVEYRLESADQVTKLEKSIEEALRTNKDVSTKAQ